MVVKLDTAFMRSMLQGVPLTPKHDKLVYDLREQALVVKPFVRLRPRKQLATIINRLLIYPKHRKQRPQLAEALRALEEMPTKPKKRWLEPTSQHCSHRAFRLMTEHPDSAEWPLTHRRAAVAAALGTTLNTIENLLRDDTFYGSFVRWCEAAGQPEVVAFFGRSDPIQVKPIPEETIALITPELVEQAALAVFKKRGIIWCDKGLGLFNKRAAIVAKELPIKMSTFRRLILETDLLYRIGERNPAIADFIRFPTKESFKHLMPVEDFVEFAAAGFDDGIRNYYGLMKYIGDRLGERIGSFPATRVSWYYGLNWYEIREQSRETTWRLGMPTEDFPRFNVPDMLGVLRNNPLEAGADAGALVNALKEQRVFNDWPRTHDDESALKPWLPPDMREALIAHLTPLLDQEGRCIPNNLIQGLINGLVAMSDEPSV